MSQASPAAHPMQTRVPPPRCRQFVLGPAPGMRGFLWYVSYRLLWRTSPPFCRQWRNLLLQLFGAHVGRGVRIARTARVYRPWNLALGDRVVIAHRALLNCTAAVTLGDDVHVSQYAQFTSATRDYERVDMPIVSRPITVGARVWIAADAYVGPGVTIGDEAIVGARAAIHDDVPPRAVVVGNPAKVLRFRNPQTPPNG